MEKIHEMKKISCLIFFVCFCLNSILAQATDESVSSSIYDLSSIESLSTVIAENVTVSSTIQPEEHASVRKWKNLEKISKKILADLYKQILPLMLRLNEDLNISPQCSRGLMKMLIAMKQMKSWSLKMFDAFGKIPNGVANGNVNTLGDYDQCLNVDVPGNFRGQYCLVDISPPLPERRPFVSTSNQIPEFINLTKPDTFMNDFLKRAGHYYRLNFRTSVCVPSTCSKEEVAQIGNKAASLAGIEFDILVPNCETKENKIKFDKSETAIIVVFSIIIFLGVIGTIIDIVLKIRFGEESYQDKQNFPVRCLLCFSFYTNTVRLLKPDKAPDTIKIFHGMKVITILWVILNHTYLYLNYQACGYLVQAQETGKEIAFQVVANGFLNVETFFFISAVLVAYAVMKMKQKKLDVGLYIFRRIWRLMPPFMFVIAIVFLIPYMGSGPVWKETVVDALTAKCRDMWWTNLLFINNFITSPKMCLQWLWYIPVDTHLYILSLIVLIPLKSNPRLAFILNGILLVFSIAITAFNHVYHGLHPTAIYVFNHPSDIAYYVDRGYFRTYLHCSTYCVGLTVGYIVAVRPKFQMSLKTNLLGWFSAFLFALTVLYGVYDWNQGNVPGMVVSTLYACTSKLVWSLCLGWVTVACVTGNGGIATSILSWPVFVPLGRLTYMTYLIHPIVHTVYLGSTRTLINLDHRFLLYIYLGNVLLSFICAYVLSLLFESPFMALEKIFLSRRPSKKSSSLKQSVVEVADTNDILNQYKKSSVVQENGVCAIKIKQVEMNG